MAPVHYNNTFGGRKLSIPPRRNGKRLAAIILLAVAIVVGTAWLVFNKTITPLLASTSKPAVQSTAPAPKKTKPAQVKTVTPPPPPQQQPATVRKTETVKAATVSAVVPSTHSTIVPTAKTTATATSEYDRLIQSAETMFGLAEFAQTRDACEKALALAPPGSPEWFKAARILGRANMKIFLTDCPLPGKKEKYRVESGDALQKIAKKFNTTVEAIQRSNRMRSDDNNIMVGQVLNVYKGDWKIIVNKKEFRLYLYDGGKLFKYYDISIGRQDRTPHGQFRIYAKVKEPDWYSPHGKVPFSAKDNVLGTRWLKLKPEAGTEPDLTGYGIHGTWDRDSIGKSRSNGCIRMLNEDVEELFDIIPHQVPVVINN